MYNYDYLCMYLIVIQCHSYSNDYGVDSFQLSTCQTGHHRLKTSTAEHPGLSSCTTA